jgi:cytidylate kinase
MYRAVGVLAAERGLALDDDAALGRLVGALSFELRDGGTALVVDGRDVSAAIRRADAGELASRVSTRPVVRERLVALQRALGEAGGVVMEGRDIGTVVFPDAPVKLYLTAAPAERARRRAAELRARGEEVDEAALAADLEARDRRDSGREHAPLRPASDARLIDTTHLGLDEVVERMAEAVQSAVRPCKP